MTLIFLSVKPDFLFSGIMEVFYKYYRHCSLLGPGIIDGAFEVCIRHYHRHLRGTVPSKANLYVLCGEILSAAVDVERWIKKTVRSHTSDSCRDGTGKTWKTADAHSQFRALKH